MVSKEFFYRVKENLEKQVKGPYCIDLVISDFCNLNCHYCFGSSNHSHKSNLSKEILIKILDSAKNLYVREISLTSLIGEPTIFKDIKFLMEEIKKRNLIGSLLTNGFMFDLEFARFMQRIHWDFLILSLDSFNPNIQYKLRPSIGQKNYLEKIIEFLEYVVKNNPEFNINLNMVVNNLNYNDIYNYFKKAESYGVKSITLLKLVKMNDNYERFALTDSQLTEFKNTLKNINSSIYFNSLEWLGDDNADVNDNSKPDTIKTEDNSKKNCYYHLYKILIDCNGQILKCNGDPQKTKFNVWDENLYDIYYKLLSRYNHLKSNPPCYEICCSPIKAINQEIDYYLDNNIY